MKHTVLRTTSAFAALATAGVSSLFLGAAPASAAGTDACGAVGTLIAPGVCEQTYTSGTSTFTATASMTQLEILLVGGGGSGNQDNGNGYAVAGGGGDVEVVDFHGSVGNIDLTVGGPSSDSTAVGTLSSSATGGGDAPTGVLVGGDSGNGNTGTVGFGGGAGAGAGASGSDGGAGVTPDSLVSGSSLFVGDTNCYGGGGSASDAVVCGAGASNAAGDGVVDPTANSGGGGGAASAAPTTGVNPGASGVIVVRWTAAPVTLSFAANGHGTAPAAQTLVAGTAPAKPADPTATGYVFKGWYTDPGLTTPADFSAAVSSNTTYYASWALALAATGGAPNAAELPIGIATLTFGIGLVGFAAYRRRRSSN